MQASRLDAVVAGGYPAASDDSQGPGFTRQEASMNLRALEHSDSGSLLQGRARVATLTAQYSYSVTSPCCVVILTLPSRIPSILYEKL